MLALRAVFNSSPSLARIAPFLVFLGLTVLQGQVGEVGQFWIYLLKCLVGIWMLWMTWRIVPEMRWEWTPRALGIGVLVCAIWVFLDPYYPKLGGVAGITWNPFVTFGETAPLAWFFFAVRLLGSSLIVPPLEEAFYRSFLYRTLVKKDFLNVPLIGINWVPFLVTACVFGLAHTQWFAGILCGILFQSLVCRSGRLGEAMAAHAVTNCLLAIWIVAKGAWQFW